MGKAPGLTMARHGRTRPSNLCAAAMADPACEVSSTRSMMAPGSTSTADTQATSAVHKPGTARVDWRLLLGVSRKDQVLVIGEDAFEVAHRLAPWAGRVRGKRDLSAMPGESGDASPFATAASPLGLPTGGTYDWIVFDGPVRDVAVARQSIARALLLLKAGGHVVVYFDNLLGLGGWFRSSMRRRSSVGMPCRGLSHALRFMASAGCTEIVGYAALPDGRAARTLIPLAPPGPPVAEKFALSQAWKRATPARALGRVVLHLLIDLKLLRHLYPHYLVVGRKPC
jgi:hypothetical protein